MSVAVSQTPSTPPPSLDTSLESLINGGTIPVRLPMWDRASAEFYFARSRELLTKCPPYLKPYTSRMRLRSLNLGSEKDNRSDGLYRAGSVGSGVRYRHSLTKNISDSLFSEGGDSTSLSCSPPFATNNGIASYHSSSGSLTDLNRVLKGMGVSTVLNPNENGSGKVDNRFFASDPKRSSLRYEAYGAISRSPPKNVFAEKREPASPRHTNGIGKESPQARRPSKNGDSGLEERKYSNSMSPVKLERSASSQNAKINFSAISPTKSALFHSQMVPKIRLSPARRTRASSLSEKRTKAPKPKSDNPKYLATSEDTSDSLSSSDSESNRRLGNRRRHRAKTEKAVALSSNDGPRKVLERALSHPCGSEAGMKAGRSDTSSDTSLDLRKPKYPDYGFGAQAESPADPLWGRKSPPPATSFLNSLSPPFNSKQSKLWPERASSSYSSSDSDSLELSDYPEFARDFLTFPPSPAPSPTA